MGRASRRKHEAKREARAAAAVSPAAERVAGAMGSVNVLNVGAGDLTLSFNKANPAERKRAAGVVKDMLRRGYAILVQVDVKDGEPVYQRVKAFDPERCEYVVIGTPEEKAAEPSVTPPKKRGRSRATRIPAEQTRTVAVARSAGG